MASIRLKVEPPKVPNFLKLETGEYVPLNHLQPDELDEVAKEWTANLHKRAEEQQASEDKRG